jgi:hypothetical protein
MARRGRPTSAADVLSKLEATVVAKERFLAVLHNLGGTLGVGEVCRKLGISPTLFQRLRSAMVRAGLAALEPRRMGRPRRTESPHHRRIRDLADEVARLKEELAMSRLREELALLIPRSQAFRKGARSRKRSAPPAA